MHNALIGALVGVAVGVVFYTADYMMLRASAAERGKKRNRSQELDATERKRLRALLTFCLFMPPAFALIFWVFG